LPAPERELLGGNSKQQGRDGFGELGRAVLFPVRVSEKGSMPLRVFTVLLTLLLGGSAAEAQTDLVHASLLANVSAIKPGEPFTVGVLLTLKPGWHVYWSNPGDAGLPTRVQWMLPSGYTASELQFPVPEHIEQPGGIVIYGYEKEVMLSAVVTPPAVAFSSAADITAKVNWLCCSEECVPGKTTVSLQLPTAKKAVADNAALFEQWQCRLPAHAQATAAPLVLSDPTPHTHILTARKVTDPKSIIPGTVDGLILTVGAPQSTAAGTTIPISAQILKGQSVTANSVPILLTWADTDTKARLGEEIRVPIVSGH
jgi:DsbC/DsbD-like thiol-disulfide interchange protein